MLFFRIAIGCVELQKRTVTPQLAAGIFKKRGPGGQE
jgi:hypothetical protein